tara:strand:+ start:1677 stop:3611 length:1935 start_codon:yes stop_codon:yes gene_type:complete
MAFKPGIFALLAVSAALAAPAFAAPTLNGPIADSAVLQRGTAIPLRGQAAPGSAVTISVAATEVSTSADATGTWQATLPAMPTGGPYRLTVRDSEGTSTFQDILIGDVILCSGQSNMEYPVYRALNPDRAIADSDNSRIRLLSIPHVANIDPQDTLPAGAEWVVAGPDTVRDFSAICYFTGQVVQKKNDVPVGLIDSSWGGSQIEAWLSADDLRSVGDFTEQLSQLELFARDPRAAMAAYGKHWEAWWQSVDQGHAPWMGDATGPGWKAAPDVMDDWKTYGDPEAEAHLGRVWFGKTFSLSAKQASMDGSLSLGLFDDTDATWLNGHFLGSTSSWTDARTYDVPAKFLKPGKNTIIINVLNTYGKGGMLGPNDAVALSLSSGESLPLGADWTYRVVSEDTPGGPQLPWETVSGYTTIHNAMISPLTGFPLYAAIWYQGESNADRGAQYQPLLERLVKSWRAHFGADLPVVIVQLPGYDGMPDRPGPSGWSDIREAQRRVAVNDPKTGLAVTIDAGDRTDIHPPNKQLVVQRILPVLAILTGQGDGVEDGIVPLRAVRDGGRISLEMPTGHLKTIGSARPIAFEICGESGACEWADATLDAAMIDLVVPLHGTPSEVRYCWGDAPICNLFSGDDVPVSPFRMGLE